MIVGTKRNDVKNQQETEPIRRVGAGQTGTTFLYFQTWVSGFWGSGTKLRIWMFLVVSCTIGGMTEQNRKRLAEAVIARRVELGMLTTTALAQASGLSTRMLGDVENGRRENFSAGAKAQIERALEWEPGSIDRTLRGKEPIPREWNQKPSRPPGPTSQKSSNPAASLVNVMAAMDNVASVIEHLRQVTSLPTADQARIDQIRQQLANSVSLLILACELVGEAIAAEDTDVASIPEFVGRLDGYQKQLSQVREIALRIDAAVEPSTHQASADSGRPSVVSNGPESAPRGRTRLEARSLNEEPGVDGDRDRGEGA